MRIMENETGVPRRKMEKINMLTVLIAAAAIFALSVTAGYYNAPEDRRLPVILSNGEVIMQPCYVAADGECIALVESEEAAEEAVARVKEEYKNSVTVEIEIEESTSVGKMKLENGAEKPEILTAKQASKKILDANTLTVRTTEVVETEEVVDYKTIEKNSDEIHQGESVIEQEGSNGINHVKKEVVKENGIIVCENIVEEETVKESVPEIIINGTAGFTQPLDEMRLTSGFGERWGRQHSGLDLGMAEGSPVYAAESGVVTCAEYCGSYGNLVKIDHGENMETYYAHCSRLDVKAGQTVEAGQQIAAVGSTGNSTGPHLHFEVRIGGTAQDPAQWLELDEQ